MDWIDDEPVWLRGPDFGDLFVGCKPAKRLKLARQMVACHEVGEARLRLFVALVMEAHDDRLLDVAVSSTLSRQALAVGPRGVRSRKPMFVASKACDRCIAARTVGMVVMRARMRSLMTNLSRTAAFHSAERLASSNNRVKHLINDAQLKEPVRVAKPLWEEAPSCNQHNTQQSATNHR